jgi:hypothetical protein
MTSATITQTHTLADAPPGWSVPLSFDDPSLGTATDVHVTVVGTITGDVSIENLGATAATFQVSSPGSINVIGGSNNTSLTSRSRWTGRPMQPAPSTGQYGGKRGKPSQRSRRIRRQ